MDATNKTNAPATTLLANPVGSGPEAAIRHVGRAFPDLVRSHALYSPADPEHPIWNAIGGSLVPPISPSTWPSFEGVYRDIFAAYLASGASPLLAAAGAEEPALAPQIIACLALRDTGGRMASV